MWSAVLVLGIWGLYAFYQLPHNYILSGFPLTFIVFIGASLLTLSYFLFISMCAFAYRKAKELPDSELPACSVIVPAYNEGKHVAETLDSLMACDYPPEKMEVFAINDGSADDTLLWIKKSAEKYPDRITVLDIKKNKGKKNALYQGIKAAAHDIIVTVDSDSIVQPDALRKLTSAFRDNKIGGVAGNIRIKNTNEGIFPKLMAVSLMFGFEVIRSSQSIIGFVMCTPGALSAYRKNACMPTIGKWLNQQFLGAPATIGEDRALSSMILRNGYKVVYQRDAIAHTCMPTTFRGFVNTLLRWARGDVRENLLMFYHMATFFPKNFTIIFRQFQIFMLLFNSLVAAAFPVTMAYCFISNILHPEALLAMLSTLWVGGVFCFVSSLIPVCVYSKRANFLDAVWGVIFPFLSLTIFAWIPLWAFITVRNSKWLTR